MDKLSLYELFSFVIPGGIALHLLNWCSVNILQMGTVFSINDLSSSLTVLLCALFIGVLLHLLTFSLFMKYKSYNQIIYKSVQEINLDEYTISIIPFLNKEYENSKQHTIEKIENYNVPAQYLFDYAYYYLEVNGKNTQAKNFQSLYFFFRNLFTLSIIAIFLLFITIMYSAFNSLGVSIILKTVLYAGGFIGVMCITVPVANWLRKKMIITVFGSYYADRVHQTNK
jgi:hypothetical protein